MKEFWTITQLVFSALGGWLGYFMGGYDGLLYALIIFVFVDYLTGIMCAITDKKLSSKTGFKGLFRKVLIFIMVGVANIIDTNVMGQAGVLRTLVIFFYLSNEGISLFENAAHLGLPVPTKLKEILEQIHERTEPKEKKMTNSSLVAYTKLSPNHSGKRTHAIDRITPHCVVGQFSVEKICGCFADKNRKASCNYAVGFDGRIGLCVDEQNRSWCSSSRDNDQRAVTIECASDLTEPYTMNDKVYAALVNLCVDICKRNGKKKLLWIAYRDKALNYEVNPDEMLLTVHRWFAKKSCPGNWLFGKLGDLAQEVNSRLGV